MSPGSTWKRRVSPGYPGVSSAVQVFWYFFPGNENAGRSAICIHRDLLWGKWTHLITCHGRDHLVNIQSVRQSPVSVNVHFEPELTLRQLRDRLHLINPIWPSYPNAVGFIFVWFQHLWSRRRTIQRAEPDIHRWWPEKDCNVSFLFSSTCPWDCSTWLHEEGLHSPWEHTHSVKDWSHFYQSTYGWGARFSLPLACLRKPGESDHSEWSRSSTSCHSQANNSGTPEQTHSQLDVQTSRFLFPFAAASRRPPFFCWSVLVRSQNSKFFLKRLRSRRFVNSHGRHLTASGRNS